MGYMNPRHLSAGLLLLIATANAQTPLPEVTLTINGHAVTAEVAATVEHRTQGLMHRRMLPENRGMVFVFPSATPQSFWMKNTYIPLSIAYIDAAGVIVNIENMKPHSTDPVPSAKPAKYALEVNRGWFDKRGIKPGMKVEGLDRATLPRPNR